MPKGSRSAAKKAIRNRKLKSARQAGGEIAQTEDGNRKKRQLQNSYKLPPSRRRHYGGIGPSRGCPGPAVFDDPVTETVRAFGGHGLPSEI